MWAISGSDLGQISLIIWTPPFLRCPNYTIPNIQYLERFCDYFYQAFAASLAEQVIPRYFRTLSEKMWNRCGVSAYTDILAFSP